MNEQALTTQADDHDRWEAALQQPDPDPETIATLAPTGWAPSDPIVAGRLLRAALRQKSTVDKLKEAMAADVEAWGLMIAAQEAREQALRRFLEAYLVATGDKIKNPWGVAYMQKGRSKIVVDDEEKAIAVLESTALGWKSIKLVKKIIKAEFDAVFNAIPTEFRGVAHEETGEPSVVIRGVK